MNINDSRRPWYTYKELIEFLNDPVTPTDSEIPEHWYKRAVSAGAGETPPPSNPFTGLETYYERQVEQTRQNLLFALDLISEYKKKLKTVRNESKDPDLLKKLEWELAVNLNQRVVSPIDAALQSEDFHINFEINTDRQSVFSPDQPWVVISPPYGNYYVTFLNMITDPNIGIDKLFRCEECPRVEIATYRRPQRFCSDLCRTRFHNRQKAPEMKEYMRIWRKKNPGMG